MQLYHFTTAQYGLDDIDRRRLKIATIPDLNDPYELLCADLSDKDLRWSMLQWKKHIGKSMGMVCFSKDWHNPVQWSHYTDKHKGLCLGFEVDKRRVLKVRYDSLRSKKEAEEVVDKRHGTFDHIEKFLTTKYTHWKYEQEYRMLVELREADVVTKLHFWEFSESMRLTDVIIGAQSSVERAQVAKVLRELKCDVQITNARLGFKKYEVVTQNDSALWK